MSHRTTATIGDERLHFADQVVQQPLKVRVNVSTRLGQDGDPGVHVISKTLMVLGVTVAVVLV